MIMGRINSLNVGVVEECSLQNTIFLSDFATTLCRMGVWNFLLHCRLLLMVYNTSATSALSM
ncbi:hypothetical protein Pan258_26110 [Symmachiella dynata]|nr:hypothetical protein Pan258_26110 [Symmachiella dynata]